MEEERKMRTIVGVLHNIRSQHNVGSMFRTADAAGLSHLYLVGYTPLPLDRFGRKTRDIAKTALGAEVSIPWTHHDNLASLLSILRDDGFQVLACEKGMVNGKPYDAVFYGEKVALVMGNEVDGLSEETTMFADHVVEIPQFGTKESLNVAVAFGIVAYGVRRATEPLL